jgi:hypothetical protein
MPISHCARVSGFLDEKLDGDFGEDGARERAGTERR